MPHDVTHTFIYYFHLPELRAERFRELNPWGFPMEQSGVQGLAVHKPHSISWWMMGSWSFRRCFDEKSPRFKLFWLQMVHTYGTWNFWSSRQMAAAWQKDFFFDKKHCKISWHLSENTDVSKFNLTKKYLPTTLTTPHNLQLNLTLFHASLMKVPIILKK